MDDWSEDINLTSNENRSISSAIASWEENVHVVYAEDEGGPGYITQAFVWYMRSEDSGESWHLKIRLDISPSNALYPKIAVWQNKIHVIWFDYEDYGIHYTRSFDNGITWSAERTITLGCFNNGWHNIAVNHSYVHITYPSTDFKVTYISSSDDGASWRTPQKLIPTNSLTVRTAIAVSGANVHIVWRDFQRAGLSPLGYTVIDIFHIKSEDNGNTWSNDINITQTPLNGSSLPDIAVSGNNIYVSYTQEWNGINQLYLSYSNNNGNTWVRNIKLTNSIKHVFAPSIFAENENIYIVWIDRRDGSDMIYFKKSSDNGLTWDTSSRITNKGGCLYPDITANEYWVHVVWWKKWGTGFEDDIFYKRYKVPPRQVEATIDFNPDTLNLKSKGRWITVYIELPYGYYINDINISTIRLNELIPAEWHPFQMGDYDNDGIPDLMVKFCRADIEDILEIMDNVTISISGFFNDGTSFRGQDIIRVIKP